jgi:nucleoid-associated protein YgaU
VLTRDASASSSERGSRSTTRPRRGSVVHVVRSGDTLWSIAKGSLDPGASPTRIWNEVQRLWRLNADRIPSGNPNLILPGLRLRMS